MKICNTSLSNLTSDEFLRTDYKYHSFLVDTNLNIFKVNVNETVPISDVLEEDYTNFFYEDDIEYMGIPTGQTYTDEDGDIIDYQPVTKDDHPNRIKYAINKDNILLSSLRLAKATALSFDFKDLNSYVFSNGFYIFKVKKGWNKKFVLYLLRNKNIKQLIDQNIYRGIGISSYKANDLLKLKIKNVSLEAQNLAV